MENRSLAAAMDIDPGGFAQPQICHLQQFSTEAVWKTDQERW